MKLHKAIGILFFPNLLPGCSSIATLSVGGDVDKAACKDGDYVPRIYSGVFNDARLIKDPPPGETLILLTDFPFSFALDTVALPYTITTQVIWGNICPPPEKEVEEDENL